jgi:RimJ/RimL family protein N-acetyltransferase
LVREDQNTIARPLSLRLLTRAEAVQVISRKYPGVGPAWAKGYPLEGDIRACSAYASHLPPAVDASDRFGYYQIVEAGLVVGGIGFHGPPSGGLVEVGYGVVPQVRGRGVATSALRMILEVAAEGKDVTRLRGRAEQANIASRRVMLSAGMREVGHDGDFVVYELELTPGS